MAETLVLVAGDDGENDPNNVFRAAERVIDDAWNVMSGAGERIARGARARGTVGMMFGDFPVPQDTHFQVAPPVGVVRPSEALNTLHTLN